MKILAVGDFHGKFPVKLRKLAKEVDLVVSIGDFFPWRFKDLFFKYSYRQNIELWDVIGKRKYKEGTLKDNKIGEKNVFMKLDGLEVPVITTVGNYDKTNLNDQYNQPKGENIWKWAEQNFFKNIIKKYKNIRSCAYSYSRFGGLVFIGAYGHSSPGQVKSKAYKKYRRKLDKLFQKFSKENKEGKVIFVFHNMPYECKLDKVRDKNAQKIVRGKHYGSKLIKRIIKKYQPVLAVGGHMHENQGRCKIGKTLVVNTGATMDGKCAIIYFDEEKGKIKSVEFVK